MTHDPDRNVFTTPIDTDVFEYLLGEGFVMVGIGAVTRKAGIALPMLEISASGAVTSAFLAVGESYPDPMPSVADEVRELEGLLK
jgi:hypothetical protein